MKCNPGLLCYDIAMSRSSSYRVLLPFVLVAFGLVAIGLLYLREPVPSEVGEAKNAPQSQGGKPASADAATTEAARREAAFDRRAGSSEERKQALVSATASAHGRQAATLLAQAMRDPDSGVREEALLLSAQLAEVEVDQAVLPLALQDEDPRVRDLAVHRVNELEVARRIEFFAEALQGSREDAALKAAEWLGVLGGKAAAGALVNAWQQGAGGSRAPAMRRALERLAGKPLTTVQEARAWWAEQAEPPGEKLQQGGR